MELVMDEIVRVPNILALDTLIATREARDGNA